MRLFILAAGKGVRLYPLTRSTPKSLLDLGDGVTLLDTQLRAAIAAGAIAEVCVITGFQHLQIEQYLQRYAGRMRVRTAFNPFFDSSNTLVSLWSVHHLMSQADFLVTNGDTLYRRNLIKALIEGRPGDGIHLAISRKDAYDDDDMKVRVGAGGEVLCASKAIPAGEVDAESTGLALVRGPAMRALFAESIVRLIKNKDNLGCFWHETFGAMADAGTPAQAMEVSPQDWSEVDFHPDVSLLRAELAAIRA